MLVSLALFALAGVLAPLATRWLGTKVFWLLALVPLSALVMTIAASPDVLGGATVTESTTWVPALGLSLSLRLDSLTWVMSLVVLGVGALVLIYCERYFSRDEPALGRFAGNFIAFAGAMYGLVLSDDVFLLFMFWEVTTVFSYLLIGHYTARKASRGAALQALLVTTAGGLAMLVGLVLVAVSAGTTSLTAIVAEPPGGTIVAVAAFLILAGAVSKSALVPFHFWLPAAMAAPTPVSAYLHAAAMVKAGVFLIAAFAPGLADIPGWRESLVVLGVLTMLVGGWRALRQTDLKLLLAYGTVSQLGFLTVMVGYGTRDTALAGITLVLAHALFKSTLFLVVGLVEHSTGTRDLRRLSGLGRARPVLMTVAAVAAASMVGLPPTLGYVGKEAALTALISDNSIISMVALAGIVLGSVLTVAYAARFLWGAFGRKSDAPPLEVRRDRPDALASPVLLATAGIALGCAAPLVDRWIRGYSDLFPVPASGHGYYLALWHGINPALIISGLTLASGLLIFWQRKRVSVMQARVPARMNAADSYWRVMRFIDRTAARVTSTTQRGSLPFYLGIILFVFVASAAVTVGRNTAWPDEWRLTDHPAQWVIGAVMIVAAIAVVRADKRFTAVVLVGVTGYGMAMLFALQGAPDLAFTQLLIETVSLVAIVLVLRRLPARIGVAHGRAPGRAVRVALSIGVGLAMGVIAVISLGARIADPIYPELSELAVEGGHGVNIVNVILVDVRGWDTMGELSVVIVAATGVASLIFLNRRTDELARPKRAVKRRGLLLRKRSGSGTHKPPASGRADDDTAQTRRAWLLAGRTLAPENRSILLEITVRLLFHSIIVVSLFVLFSGHNSPGGGFAGGLIAGMALVARYLAGGRYELAAAVTIDAGKLLGTGLLLAVGTATVPLLFGAEALTSSFFEVTLPVLGHIAFVTSTIFDVGVYLVVIGLVLDVLRSLGGEVDRQQEIEDPNTPNERLEPSSNYEVDGLSVGGREESRQ